MADSDKNILITPNRGSTTDLPKIEFTGADPNTITLSVLDDATLSFSGSSGQLFSISDSLTGTIFSVNDVSGIPSIEVDDDGTVRLAEFGGNLLVGTDVDVGDHKVQIKSDVYNHPLHITSAFGDKIKLTSTHASVQSNTIDFYANDKNTGSVRANWSSNFKEISLGVSFDTDANTQGRRLYIPMTGNPYFRYGGTSDYTVFHDAYHPNADKLTTTRNIALTGAVTGNANFDGSSNISISTTATADPTLTLTGDVTGSATFTNLGNATLTATVANDSHNHYFITSNTPGNAPDNALQYWQASGQGLDYAPTTDWYNTIRGGHGDPNTYYSNTLAMKMTGSYVGTIHTQARSNGTLQGWNQHWHSNNDGPGSGLDADLLDGIEGSNYLRSDVVDTLCTSKSSGTLMGRTGFSDFIGYNPSYGSYIGGGVNNAGRYIYAGGYISEGSIGTLWRSTNDGSGSGLDADLLDGLDSSAFARAGFVQDAWVDFTVDGDANTYYPVSIEGGGHFAFQMYSISRGYNWTAPSTWNTSSHKGGLTLTWQYSGDGFWGGNDHDFRIIKFDETYTTMVTKMAGSVGGGGTHAGIVVWLRGGGAQYRFHGPKGSTGDVNVHLSSVTAANGTVFAPISYSSSEVANTINTRYPIRGSASLYDGLNKVWHAGNDGPGTGLDADLLDGIDSASFLRSDANDTASGQYNFTKVDDHAIQVGTIRGRAVGSQSGQYIHMYDRVHIGSPNGWGSNPAPSYGLSTYGGAEFCQDSGSVKVGDNIAQTHGGLQILRNGGTPSTSGYSVANGASIEIYSNNEPVLGFHNSGNSACSLYESAGDLYLTRWNGTATGSRLWHSNNDGSGSGLDADLLDGTQGWDVAGLDYLGWAPAYSNTDSNTIRYYHAAGAVGLQGSDTSMGMAYKAVYVPPGSTISFSIAARASAASSSGFYLRIYGRSSLSDGKTHVSHTAGTSPLVEEDQFGNTGWIENAAIGTDWKVYKKDHTTNAGGWFSLVALNWSGMGTNVLYVRKPEIVIKQTTTNRNVGTYVLASQNSTDATALNIGDTISGSSLRPAAIMPAGNSLGASPSTSTDRISGATVSIPGTDDNSSSTLTGTWQLMGAYADNYSYNDFPVSLWLRIS